MRKFTAVLLVFSLMMLYANLYAEEKRGAKLIVTKKGGLLIEGELITVKENGLLLLDTEGKDVTVGIEDIFVIRIVKKPQVAKGALGGLLGGFAFGASMVGLLALLLKASVGEALPVMAKAGGQLRPPVQ